MKIYKSIFIALAALTQSGVLLNSCANTVDDYSTSISMQTTAFSGAQGSCTNGGVKVDILIDGVVQSDQTQYICNGSDGKDGEDGKTEQNGHNTLVATSDEVGANCANGGMRIDNGLDANDNGTLETTELLSTRYVCNGSNGKDGEDGQNGKNASIQTTAFSGAQGSCTNGGVKVEILIDGVVQSDQTQYICNGSDGKDAEDSKDGQNGHNALVATSDEVGANCANGGMRIDIGLDANDNGTLETTELLSTRYVCNGVNGKDGEDGEDGQNGKNASIQTTAFSGAQGSCTNGGVKVDILIDGVVQSDQTQYICNGTNGMDGKDGSVITCNGIIVDTKFDSANCGSCGNVCQAGFECVNSSCNSIANMSTAMLTCNAQNINPYNDHNYCGGCGIACSDTSYCKAGVCTTLPAIGDIITFGHYEQDNNTTNGKEPITWRVLDVDSTNVKVLIISEKALDVQPYNTTHISITWAKSTIRSWLNGYAASYNTVGKSYTSDNFIDAAFTTAEKAKIVSSNVPAHVHPYYTTSPGLATTDKIFLLSITETQHYFTSDKDRQADATRYAVKKGAYVKGSVSGKYTDDGSCTDVHCYSYWWLRSPGDSNSKAEEISALGSIGVEGTDVSNVLNVAVRPALWVNL